LLAKVRDKNGHITIPGFYDGVTPLSKYERAQTKRYPMKDAQLKALVGARQLFGERGFSATEQRSARPTFEINGLTSGYQGEGSKTIVPSWARAKITCRLVPDQNPARIREAVCGWLKKNCPPSVKLGIKAGHGAEAYHVSPEGKSAQAALQALRLAFGREPIVMREGGSIPIVNDFKRILGADTLLLGLALPDDNAHSPNEKFSLDAYAAGMRMSAALCCGRGWKLRGMIGCWRDVPWRNG
jgi:acetylornithine deacetylase/succinyl-diaminopimelate desuccinylase-like protein